MNVKQTAITFDECSVNTAITFDECSVNTAITFDECSVNTVMINQNQCQQCDYQSKPIES